MREILFRAKRVDNGEWVYGYYVEAKYSWHNRGKHKEWIVCTARSNGGWFALETKYAVIGKTVGQFTGLTDRNGKKIFEGDIVDILSETEEYGTITYEDSAFIVEADGFCLTFTENIDGKDLEVIGDIYDNHELLGE